VIKILGHTSNRVSIVSKEDFILHINLLHWHAVSIITSWIVSCLKVFDSVSLIEFWQTRF
jgi:hypothetical protein